MNDRTKILLYSRVEGGNVQLMDFDLYEDELSSFDGQTEKRKVFNKGFKSNINTRVVKFGKKYIHAFFLEDGRVYDCNETGFRERKDYNNVEWINKIAKEKANG